MSRVVNLFTSLGNLDRPVVDGTGLPGTFDFVMEYTPESPTGELQPGLSFQEAMKNQLGLKLVAQKVPYDFLIVDHVEHPTEN